MFLFIRLNMILKEELAVLALQSAQAWITTLGLLILEFMLRPPPFLGLSHGPTLDLAHNCFNPSCRLNLNKTSQELRMLSTVTLDCQVTKIVKNLGSQL